MLPQEVFFTIISAIITLFIGITANMLSERLRKRAIIEHKTVEDALAASEIQLDKARTDVVDAILRRMPDETPPAELADAITRQLRVGSGDIIINQTIRERSEFVQELVTQYHQQALSQSRVQFWFSLFAACVGFGFIIYSALNLIVVDQLSSYLSIAPGTVIDIVAAMFLRQAEQTRQRATELYDRLRNDNNIEIVRRLLDSIEDPKTKSAAQAQIALHLSGISAKDIDLAKMVFSVLPSTEPTPDQAA